MAIDKDIKCQQCGYNLRGLGEKGACPECAASIAASIRFHRPPRSMTLTKIAGVWLVFIVLMSLIQWGIIGGSEHIRTQHASSFIAGWIVAILASLYFHVIAIVRPQETLFVHFASTLASLVSFVMLLVMILANV